MADSITYTSFANLSDEDEASFSKQISALVSKKSYASSFSALRTGSSLSGQMSNGKFLTLKNSSTFQNVNANALWDLRNINNKNFRGNEKNDSTNLSPSKSFFMGKDYQFAQYYSETYDTSIKPDVQKLIINEFQPYQMFTLADILDEGVMKHITQFLINGTLGDITAPLFKIGRKICYK